MSDITVLLSSAGRRGALLNAIRHGGETAGVSARVVVTDRSPLSAAGHLADAFRVVPSVSAPDFIETMVSIIERDEVDVIVPTIDTELPVLARHRADLERAGAKVLVSAAEAIDICGDKQRSSEWLAASGFPVPRQFTVEETTALDPGLWPLFFKPRQGSSSIGAHAVHSPAELDLAIERYGPGVVEELIVGDEYTMDCWLDGDGTCRCVVPRLRIAVRAGEVAKGSTVSRPDLERVIAAVAEAIPGGRGPVTIQALDGPDGPRIIEINPRFGGGYPLSHRAGARYTAALVAEVLGKPVDPEWFVWERDLIMLRYDEAVFVPKAEIERLERSPEP